MKCAILALPEIDHAEEGLWKRMLKSRKTRYTALEIPYAAEDVWLVQLPYTDEELQKMTQQKRERLWLKYIYDLREKGVSCVYLPNRLLRFEETKEFGHNFILPDGKLLFRLLIGRALKFCAQRQREELSEAMIGVWQDCFDENGYIIMEKLSDSIKYLTLFSNTPSSAGIYAERLYLHNGLSAQISERLNIMSGCKYLILADGFYGPALGEQTAVFDICGDYPYRCFNTLEFNIPFGFHIIAPYFDSCDQRCMDFLFNACSVRLGRDTDAWSAVKSIGCDLKNVMYKSHKLS